MAYRHTGNPSCQKETAQGIHPAGATHRESTLQNPSPPGQLFINLLITEGSGPFITVNTADIRFNFAQRCTLSLQVVITHMPGVAKPHNTSEVSGQGSLRDLSQVPAASRRPTMRQRRTAPALQGSKTRNTILKPRYQHSVGGSTTYRRRSW